MKYTPIELEIDGEVKKVYRVNELDEKIFRGLQIYVEKSPVASHWYAYELTTRSSLMPNSWDAAFNNRTRDATMSIVAHRLTNLSEYSWKIVQEKLNYQLKRMGFKWGQISKQVWQAQNDITDVCNMAPSDKYGEADTTELDQWTVDEIYNFLETAKANIHAAMEKLKPNTTYHKDEK